MATFLPDANFTVTGSGTLTTTEINDKANTPRDLTATVTAHGSSLPLLYGRRDIPGLIFALGYISTDLVIGVIWCMGEIDAIENIYINDAVVPASPNVIVTNYLGTPSQTVNTTLQSAIAGYNDSMRVQVPGGSYIGIAYSVFRIKVGALTAFPKFRAVCRGRKVYDPRTATTAYSDNTALALNDLITNPVFGLGRTCLGTSEVADWDDTLLGGVAGAYRSRIALYISSARPAEEYVDLLCEYAECFKVFEGSAIRLIPDMPVDLLTVPVVPPSEMMKSSLRLEAASSTDTPTEIEFQYTLEPTTATQPWSLTPVTVQLPGVAAGEIQRIPTSLSMEGITRDVEAQIKALSKLNRLQNRMTVSWDTTDRGVINQRGDVVRVQHPKRGVDIYCRIMNVNMVGAGRYSVTADRYDSNFYPDDIILPPDIGVVPVGAIGMLIGTVVPDGWALFNDANDKYIIGAGGSYAVGSNGTSTVGPWTGTSSSEGSHSLQYGGADMSRPYSAASGNYGPLTPATDSYVGSHSHNYSIASVTEDIVRRENVLVIKTGSPGLNIPPTVRVFGLPNTVTTATKNISFSQRLLMAKSSSGNAGTSPTTTSATISSADDSHSHIAAYGPRAAFGSGEEARTAIDSGGVHTHTATVSVTFNPKRRQLCCFESGTNYSVSPGLIFMWSGSLGSLPTDFVLCDGTNGTVDMRDYFVEFTGTTPTSPTGNNTVTFNGTSSSVGHSHDAGPASLPGGNTPLMGHAATYYHNHVISTTKPYTPKYYALGFIMYSPGV